jgi:hypothetical protein
MENIEIPDDFYIYDDNHGHKYLCHKSCTYKNSFLNNKFQYLPNKLVLNEIIAKLRYICNINDEIEEKTYFINYKFNDLCHYVHDDLIYLYGPNYKYFSNVKDFLEYLTKNHPECIRNNDIKIALKD